LTRERWIFLFAAISAVCALAAFLKVDLLTVASLFGTGANVNAPVSSRDAFIVFFVFLSLVLSGFGFWTTEAGNRLYLTRHQKRILLREAAKIRTLMRGILISDTNGNPATEPFAHELGEVFNSAGIAAWFVHARPDNPNQSGLLLCIRDLNNPRPATEDLKGALRSANIQFEVSGFPRSDFSGSTPPDEVEKNLVLWVAPKTL
jgi:hypothetical protein